MFTSCSFCGGVIGRAGVGAPKEKGFETSAALLPVDGPPKSVVGAETAGVAGVPNVNAGLLSDGVATGGVDGAAPNENGDFAGVTGAGAVGAVELKLNPPVLPVEVDGNRGLGASIDGAGVDGEGVPKVKAGLGASALALAWLPPKGEGDEAGGAPKSDGFDDPLVPKSGLVSAGFADGGSG